MNKPPLFTALIAAPLGFIVALRFGDLSAAFLRVMKHGLGMGKNLGTIQGYPTLATAHRFAAGDRQRAHVNPTPLAFAKHYHDWKRG